MIPPTEILLGVAKSASRKRTLFSFGALTMFAALAAGCATGPRYTYTQQKDSANVEGSITPVQNPDNGNCSVIIVQVDGLTANFGASSPGINWPTSKKSLYLEPGKHAISLDISDIVEEYGSVGHGGVGEVGADAYGSTPTITVKFTANHIYRFSGYLRGRMIEIVLWDETGGAATRFRAESWTFDGNGNHSDSAEPSGNHR